jgi:C-5 cytosine-specific DNA methylase
MQPVAIDLFCGLGGWAEGLLAEGYDVVGFDVERHIYGKHRYPAQLVIQDVLTLHGAQFRDAALIVASPPCQAYSYRAMPWSRAKALPPPDNTLFEACFRIQREACEAAGRHIPLIVENVRGAQRWVGHARWNYGSFYLWGDVPALMPVARAAAKVPSFRFDGGGQSFQSASVRRTAVGNGARFTSRDCGVEGRKHQGDWFRDPSCPTRLGGQRGRKYDDGVKQPGINLSQVGFNVANVREFGHIMERAKYERTEDDKRQHIGITRKFASAMIAKIPLPLARHIGAVFHPRNSEILDLTPHPPGGTLAGSGGER